MPGSHRLPGLTVIVESFRQQIHERFPVDIHHQRGVGLIARQRIVVHHRHTLSVFPLGFHAYPPFYRGKHLRFEQPGNGARIVQRRAVKTPFLACDTP